MRGAWKTISIGLAVLSAVALFSIPQAFAAKASFDQPPGDPPYGLATQGDRGGTKLYGVITLEYNLLSETNANVWAVVRLRKGNELKVFYSGKLGNTLGIDFQDPKIIQLAVTNALEPQILGAFFPGETGLCVWFKSAAEYAKSSLVQNTPSYFFEVMDFEIAVSSCR